MSDLAGADCLIGKSIVAITIDDAWLHIATGDGKNVTVGDYGQCCCESRYVRTDDEVQDFVGAEVTGAEIRDIAEGDSTDGDCHDVQFLLLKTSKGDLTLSCHNEHNGYYGGFDVQAKEKAGDA